MRQRLVAPLAGKLYQVHCGGGRHSAQLNQYGGAVLAHFVARAGLHPAVLTLAALTLGTAASVALATSRRCFPRPHSNVVLFRWGSGVGGFTLRVSGPRSFNAFDDVESAGVAAVNVAGGLGCLGEHGDVGFLDAPAVRVRTLAREMGHPQQHQVTVGFQGQLG